MKSLTSSQIRSMFLEFFQEKGHMIEPGASLVPHNDPTLLWINAGVAALKKYFDGSLKPQNPRIVNAQKSIRTNDIENVGKTARHHTFFEMLGNFSIGDYFKKDAILYAWEFLTSEQWLGLDKEKLYISVYEDDMDTYQIWIQDCKVDPSHILKTKNNFWEIGEGPGGPDSEIFYDRGDAYDPQGLKERLFFEELENDRYIEVWNIVFSQYDCDPSIPREQYKELPQKNIDTGMGLERLVALIQNGETNFDTDLFLPMIRYCEKLTKIPYEGTNKMAYRVIADHIRTVTFALADGAIFSNEGRGYVLRRVLRRAVRFGKQLGMNEAFMYQLVPIVYEVMKDFYPYLKEKLDYISKLVKAEEQRFHATLAEGERLLQQVMQQSKEKKINGDIAFQLYDTYGFPFELTLEIASEQGYQVDQDGFSKCMEEQKQRARDARADVQSMSSQSKDLMAFTKESEFVGYTQYHSKSKVIGLFQNGKQVDVLKDEGEVIFDRTPFYAESGGQVCDEGTIIGEHFKAMVVNVKKASNQQHLHTIRLLQGTVHIGDLAELEIQQQKRVNISANHSCTHLIHAALRTIIGTHIEQAGSYVCDEYLRFDFSHYEKLTLQQLQAVEEQVNRWIQENHAVVIKLYPIAEAKQLGAMALFDEKYGDEVRVVSIGNISKEFCGGCHVAMTKEIGLCKITQEESVGSGVRRIVAKTGFDAYQYIQEQLQVLQNCCELLHVNSVNKLEEKVAVTAQHSVLMKKQLQQLQYDMSMLKANELLQQVVEIGNKQVIVTRIDDIEVSALKDMVQNLKTKLQCCVICIASVVSDKIVFVCGADDLAIQAGVHSGEIVKMLAEKCDGKGGGRKDLAQAGGKNIEKLEEALQSIKNMLE